MKAKSFLELTPREIVTELDKYIIGQNDAKRAVAVALRNRMRRMLLPQEIRDEIAPANILMVGPTGVGKTEISRRIAKLAGAPFVKAEASKFTEVGYVGKDVDSMVRDLMQNAVDIVKSEEARAVEEIARKNVLEKLMDTLFPAARRDKNDETTEAFLRTRAKVAEQLENGSLDDENVEITVDTKTFKALEVVTQQGTEEIGFNINEMMGDMFGKKKRKVRKMSIKEAKEKLLGEEIDKLVDMEKIVDVAKMRCEEMGIVFIDEIDKIIGTESSSGPDVSRHGVQRDLLPLIEGTSISTKYGVIRTDHILFIAAGAFSHSSPADLIPELQGRLPIRVELSSLNVEDFKLILTLPRNSLINQYKSLLFTEGIDLGFSDDAIDELATIAHSINSRTENTGARRLQTVMMALLSDLLFDAPDIAPKTVQITSNTIKEKLSHIIANEDLTKFIL